MQSLRYKLPCLSHAAAVLSLALAITALATKASAQTDPAAPPPANVRVGLALNQQVRDMRLVVGQIEPARRTTLTTQQPGQVVQAPQEPGLPVTKNQIIAKLDDRLLIIDREAAQSAITEATALIEEQQALLETAERNRYQLEQLFSRNATNQTERDDAIDRETATRARLRITQAQLASAQSRLHRLEQQIEYTNIKSPFNGFIVRKLTELGQWIAPGDPIAEIVETSRVKARLDVPQAMIANIPTDTPVTLNIDAINTARHVPLFSIVPDADPQARTFRVLFKIPNEDGSLKPGMSVTAELPTSTLSNRLTVPKDAVQSTPTGTVVTVNRNNTASPVPVTVRFSVGDRFVVDGPLNHNDQVVVEGNERLQPGQAIAVVNANDIKNTN